MLPEILVNLKGLERKFVLGLNRIHFILNIISDFQQFRPHYKNSLTAIYLGFSYFCLIQMMNSKI